MTAQMPNPLEPGRELTLTIEKPAAGGRMIARHEGQVVLVRGAIPGERVRARVTRGERQLAFAETVDVIEASPDRRDPGRDPLCGGCLYAHVGYDRQLGLKAEVIRDAFLRLGRIRVEEPVTVAPSPERGYRMRARLHVHGGQAGFYREGTHELCEAAQTGQLSGEAVEAAARAASLLRAAGCPPAAVEVAENLAATERVLHITATGELPATDVLDAIVASGGVTGCSAAGAGRTVRTSGVPIVSDPLPVLTGGRAADGTLERHAESFFQANRFLLPALVQTVLDAVPGEGPVLDLYAGVGLFSVALAASGRSRVTAVEGDRSSSRDLRRNASAWVRRLRAVAGSVEDYVRRPGARGAGTIVVDPPRTGVSRQAMEAIAASGAGRIVYVSCDPATMARDARRLLDAGYAIAAVKGFDLFPNTPHVETVAVFDRGAAVTSGPARGTP